MINPFRYGNKAALIVGVFLMLIDTVPLAHEFGAWPIGCLLCFWYSATAVSEDPRLNRKVRFGLFAYLIIVLVVVLSLHGSGDEEPGKHDWSLPSALKSMGVEARKTLGR